MENKIELQCSLPGEEWKAIEGFERYYISNMGRVWSTVRNILIKQRLSKGGYYRCNLYNEDGMAVKPIANMVGKAFCPGWAPGLTIDHMNGTKDNRASQLQ